MKNKNAGLATRQPSVDGRSRQARRFKRLCGDLAGDLGGEDSLTAAEAALVRQAAVITMQAEEAQTALLRGETVDSDDLVRLSNASTRLLSALGVARRKRQPAAVAPWKAQQ
jgi:hypothetical protein